MKAKELAEILLKNPDYHVSVQNYTDSGTPSFEYFDLVVSTDVLTPTGEKYFCIHENQE